MENEKNKLIKEIIIDCIFVIILIVVTIYGVINVFPVINNVEVVTIKKFECDNAYDCVCNGNKCNCKYCMNEECNMNKYITCNK